MLVSFRNLSVIGKITIPAFIVAAVAFGIVLYASIALLQLSDNTARLVDKNASRVQLALQAESAFNSAAVSEKNVILSASDEKAAKSNIASYNKATDATLVSISQFEAITGTAEQRSLIEEFRAAVNSRRKASSHVFELALEGNVKEAFDYSRDVAAKHRQVAMAAVGKLIASNIEQIAEARNSSIATAQQTRTRLIFGAVAGLVAAFGILGWIAIYEIAGPISSMTRSMLRLAGGDLQIDVADTERRDEIGGLARSLQVFRDNAADAHRLEQEQTQQHEISKMRHYEVEQHIAVFDAQVREALEALSAASSEMHATAGSMSATATQTSTQAAAAMHASDQVSNSGASVAAATEELHASTNEISRQVTQSANFASVAVVEAERTNLTVKELASAAQKIGEVVSFIQGIASQTNLLALNATIEAARAGEAGRGFAIVASEVKLLATQTAKATEDISTQILAIQNKTSMAVEAIAAIETTIRKMHEVAGAVAAAVEEQGIATQNIANNIQLVAQNSITVSKSIAEVNEAACETGTGSTQVLAAAEDLSRQSEKLRSDVNDFLSHIRVA